MANEKPRTPGKGPGRPAAKPEAQLSPAPETKSETYTADQVQEMIRAAVSQALAQAGKSSAVPEGVVTVAYLAEVSRDNVLTLPEYGSLRPNSFLEVPKKEFGGKFMSPLVRKLLEKRHLIVVDGLSDEERERWGCRYREGEVLTQRAFDHMLDYSLDQLRLMFPALCPEHQKFVCRRFLTMADQGDNRVNYEKVKLLNDLSKKNFPDGLLRPVLERYGKEEL